MLEDWRPTVQDVFLFYQGHRRVPAALRAFIDMIHTALLALFMLKRMHRESFGLGQPAVAG